MIVDIHSHFWEYPAHFSDDFRRQAMRGRPDQEVDLTVRWEEYDATSAGCEKTVVFGGKAKLSGMWVPDKDVAAYVAKQPDRLLGFLCLDPSQPGWEEELIEGHQNLKMKGIKLLPMYSGYKPNDRSLDYLWEYATKHNLPVLLHTGTTFISQAPLECTRPIHLDDVAIRFPHVKIIMAHLSHPYEGECVVTIRKHPNVYADNSALYYRPWQYYNSLMLVQEYAQWKKVLFGTDYPFTTVADTIKGIRGLNDMLEGTALPRLNVDRIEEMIHRNTLDLLEISA